MKKYTNLILVGFCLLLAQSGDISADPKLRSIGTRELDSLIRRFDIKQPIYKDLLYAATCPGAQMILHYEENPWEGVRVYPSNVLRAARDIAAITQGTNSRIYIILERMLSYK